MTDDPDGEAPAEVPGPERDHEHDGGDDRLRRQVTAAIEELASLRCPDPAAVDAFLTARLALHTLRAVWLPNC